MNQNLSLNPFLQNVPVYVPGRPIEEVAREMGLNPADIIKLASNENPLGPSPAAIAAMQHTINHLHLYPDGNAFYLKGKLAAKLGVGTENLILGNGSNEIIEFVGHALMSPGVEVIVSQYCFAVYNIVTHLFGATPVVVPAVQYGHDLAGMLRAITPKTRVIFVANPNNPTGTLAAREQLLEFVDQVPGDVLLAIDEAYLEFLDEPLDLLPFIRTGKKRNLLLMRTFSKIFGLAGLRLGYGIAHPDVISGLEKIRQPFNINSIAQAGALAALEDEEHIRRTRDNNRAGLRFFEKGLADLGVEYVPSSANFILLRVGNGAKVCQDLQKAGVIVRPMGGYQLPEWIRISIGSPAENERCLSVLAKILK